LNYNISTDYVTRNIPYCNTDALINIHTCLKDIYSDNKLVESVKSNYNSAVTPNHIIQYETLTKQFNIPLYIQYEIDDSTKISKLLYVY